MADQEKQPKNYIPLIRDVVLLLGGLGIAIHETLYTAGERPSILIMAAGMMGLPIFLRKDSSGGNDGG